MTSSQIVFDASHRGTLRDVELFDLYAHLLNECSLGSVTHFWIGAYESNDLVSGAAEALRRELLSKPQRQFALRTASNVELRFFVEASTPTQWRVSSLRLALDRTSLEAVVSLCEELFRLPDPPSFLGLARAERDVSFVPSPPIARHRHVMMTTEAEVAEMYDAPSVFWRQWDTVHAVGDRRLCIRGRKNADLYDFIARIFESNMVLAHHARPGLTEYRLPDARFLKRLETEYYTWWKLGPCAEELGGMPALTFVGHDTNADVFHYTGFIEPGKHPEHGRVQIRELLEVKDRCYTDAGDNAPGRVHVLFPEEWMARQERRPLRDVGARVFFYGKDGTKVEVTD